MTLLWEQKGVRRKCTRDKGLRRGPTLRVCTGCTSWAAGEGPAGAARGPFDLGARGARRPARGAAGTGVGGPPARLKHLHVPAPKFFGYHIPRAHLAFRSQQS